MGEESLVGNQETKDRELEEDGYIWTMDNVDSKSLYFKLLLLLKSVF